ncbi:MAG: MFS transporter [Rikenellaceae bacterium]
MKSISTALIAVIFSFFVMGFTDTVGIASNYVKSDLSLSDTEASVFMTMVFLWFLILSIPTSMLMNRIGRKNTALVSLLLMVVAFSVALLGNSYPIMIVAFTILGVANVLMQTSVNALMSNIVDRRNLESSLTFGQFVKSIASFTAPYLAMWGAVELFPSFGLGWRVMFLIYAVMTALSLLMLLKTPIKEEAPQAAANFKQSVALLKDPFILICFLGIISLVGVDVGTNSFAPKILIERLNLTLGEAGFITSLYFICRVSGCFLGSILLRHVSPKLLFGVSMLLMTFSMGGLFFASSLLSIYVCVGLVGLFNANAFPIVLSQALVHKPQNGNEISGLMMMGLIGGAIFPSLMGIMSDSVGLNGAVAVMMAGVLYLLFYTRVIRPSNKNLN